tara:strand:- start:207 stop:1994 length:1788 start_codon:yes stop_codon:yes gene_type:complete
MKRTHNCGKLRKENVEETVTLCGWVDRRRDLGGIIFIDLRDKYGKTQVVFNPEHNPDVHEVADALRNEFVIQITGKVQARPEGMINEKLPTGTIDIMVDELVILNKSETSPLSINDHNEVSKEGDDVRLKYRFLDLRRPWNQKKILLKSKFLQNSREFFAKHDFEDIETPILCKSTPEGARDYLVPSRVNPGQFYALPQSPQTYKQLLMIAGFDRYYQIAKCFRDEDLRADRQPEFTQIDVEMSFVEQEDILSTFDDYISEVLPKTWPDLKVELPIERMPYEEAMMDYGSDKPDLRFGLKIKDVSDIAATCGFGVFKAVAGSGGAVRGIAATGCVDFTRKTIDELTKFVGRYGAKGLVWMRVLEDGSVESQVAKFFKPEEIIAMKERLGGQPGDMLFFIAADEQTTANSLGHLRLEVAKLKGLMDSSVRKFVWITDFPMFEYSENEGRYTSMHHPFTAPFDEHIENFESGNLKEMKSKAYDLVLNGVEIGGGSIRIHNPEIQQKAFKALGLSEEEVEQKFGYFVNAFKYGAPPHGGLAFGLDRIVATMEGVDSIRDFIPFPKTSTAASLMENCPSPVDSQQLLDVHVSVNVPSED